MIGIDLVSIRRIESLIKKYDIVFLKKILNDDEITKAEVMNSFSVVDTILDNTKRETQSTEVQNNVQ